MFIIGRVFFYTDHSPGLRVCCYQCDMHEGKVFVCPEVFSFLAHRENLLNGSEIMKSKEVCVCFAKFVHKNSKKTNL